MFADQGRVIFTLLVLLFLGWFALGIQLNIRRGNAVLTWLQDGLKLLGSKTTLRWLGSSGVELKVQEPIAPFRWAQVFVVLEPRDVPFLWWLSRRRGRRELLILRGHLQSMPTFELEALDAGSWSTRHVERDMRAKAWVRVDAPMALPLVVYGHGARNTAAAVLDEYFQSPSCELTLVRLAIRQETPNLEIQWRLAGFEACSARRLFESFLRIAERVRDESLSA